MKGTKFSNEDAASCSQLSNIMFAFSLIALVASIYAAIATNLYLVFIVSGVVSFVLFYGASALFSAVASIAQRVDELGQVQKSSNQ